MSRLLSFQKNCQNKIYFCPNCINSFRSEISLEKHQQYCFNHNHVQVEMPKKGTLLNFKNYYRGMRVPFVIYADFECITSVTQKKIGKTTNQNQIHKPSGFAFLIKCLDDEIFPPLFISYTAKNGKEDVGGKFVELL